MGFQSSFNGVIADIPEIAVDNFTSRRRAYFLSHFHGNHTFGLGVGARYRQQATRLRDNGGKIYVSEQTKVILSHKHENYEDIESLVEPLKTGVTYDIPLTDEKSIMVTLIPVKHMVGAVMFLFHSGDQTILFTGDFLMEPDDVYRVEDLHDEDIPKEIDTLYVDSTFNHTAYLHFPEQRQCHDEATEAILQKLSRYRGVSLVVNYQFGYEDLFHALSERLQTKLFTSDSSLIRVYYHLYGEDHPLTSDGSSRIHVRFRNEDVRPDYYRIEVSAIRGCYFDPGYNNAFTPDDAAGYLCYPTHCSQSQLNHFLEYFSPIRNIVRFPTDPVYPPIFRQNCPYAAELDRQALGD